MTYQVLIVDDEEIVCRGLTRFVKWSNYGFQVAGTASDGEEALSLLKKTHIDVVFMDIRMPGMTGLELLKILRKEYPAVKAVILSGYSDFSYAQEAIRNGASDYLTKPVVLKDIEVLLERLRGEFAIRQKESQIHTNRLEALLLSSAKGYSQIDSDRYDLPNLKQWYGFSMILKNKELCQQDIDLKKQQMRNQLTSLIPSAIFLDDEIFSLFVLLPWDSDSSFDSLTSLLEQLCSGLEEWFCGASSRKFGLEKIHEGWEEARRARHYHRAGTRDSIILYQNIEQLFSAGSQSLQDILPEIFRRLTNPETRINAIPLLEEAMHSLLDQSPSLTQYQTACISFLIELNSYLKDLRLNEEELHTQLNSTLSHILLARSHKSSADSMTSYIEWLISLLNRSDEQTLSKDVIREIQLFICQHYAENISLNFLAEQFYLHPNYLSRLFKEKTGRNFIEYLTEIRMEKVKELLRNSDKKIVEICDMTGYDNPRYFSKVFKQYTGMTPREYRDSLPQKSPEKI